MGCDETAASCVHASFSTNVRVLKYIQKVVRLFNKLVGIRWKSTLLSATHLSAVMRLVGAVRSRAYTRTSYTCMVVCCVAWRHYVRVVHLHGSLLWMVMLRIESITHTYVKK